MNGDTGEAETPAHPLALAWRRDLDYKIKRYDEQADREYALEERIAAMSPEEVHAALRAAAEKDLVFKRSYSPGTTSLDVPPSANPRSLASRLQEGPVSAAEARRARGLSW